MLVLSRKIGKRVCIGNAVIVTVAAVQNGRVRLCFNAPDDVTIDRKEVRARRFGGGAAERLADDLESNRPKKF